MLFIIAIYLIPIYCHIEKRYSATNDTSKKKKIHRVWNELHCGKVADSQYLSSLERCSRLISI